MIKFLIKIIFSIFISNYVYTKVEIKNKKIKIMFITVIIYVLFLLISFSPPLTNIYYSLSYSTINTLPFLFLLLLIFYSGNKINKKAVIKSFLFCSILYLIAYYIYFGGISIGEMYLLPIIEMAINTFVYFITLIFLKFKLKNTFKKIDFDNDKIEIIEQSKNNKKHNKKQ